MAPILCPHGISSAVRQLADARKRIPKVVKDARTYLIGPTWRGDWAFDGEVLVDEAAFLSP